MVPHLLFRLFTTRGTLNDSLPTKTYVAHNLLKVEEPHWIFLAPCLKNCLLPSPTYLCPFPFYQEVPLTRNTSMQQMWLFMRYV
jgi:hypothetical protein